MYVMPGNRFTIFDMMAAKGVFSSNPANADSIDRTTGQSLYKGPVPYPKMFYHPEGLERVIVPRITVDTPFGPRVETQEQREIVFEIAHSLEDERRLRKDGWHDHPAKAMVAAGREAPPITPANRIADLEAALAEANRKLEDERKLRTDFAALQEGVDRTGLTK